MSAEPLFSLRGVRFGYPGREVLAGIDLDLLPGERLALTGGNGAGKTTLLHLLVGLCRPAAGTITAFGRERRAEPDFHEVRGRAGLLFQDADDQLFCPTVLEDVAFGPLNLGKSRAAAIEIALRTLDQLGLAGFGERITYQLSGGEKRLVTLAAVLAMEPEALLLDEPTNGLDQEAEARLVRHLQALPQAMILVSHDPHLIAALTTRSLLLQGGRLLPALVHDHAHSHPHLHAPGVAHHAPAEPTRRSRVP
jgi:cobalt/nickel transport system ATP-binding protein